MAVKKFVWVGIGIAVLGTAGYFTWDFFKKKKDEEQQKIDKQNAIEAAKIANSSAVPAFPLKKGMKGEEVKKLQTWLNTNFTVKKNAASKNPFEMLKFISIQPLRTDGLFGTMTENMLVLITSKKEMDKATYDNAKIANA